MIKQIALSQLILSPQNVRKTGLNDGLDELQASIQHHGLQQNLVVVANENGQYAVIAGGRRLRALQALSEQGLVVPNCQINETGLQIPCQIVEGDTATEISLAENIIRVAMHPADQFAAWQKMIEEGKTAAQVATRFGVTEELVQRRLKLAKVSPILLQAYRDDAMTLECLMAFTLCDDFARQETVWQELSPMGCPSPYQIRNALTSGSVPSSSKLAKFVGEAEYEAAGGYISRDLFQETAYFEDATLLQTLAQQKLDVAAATLRDTWQWVTVMIDRDYSTFSKYRQLDKSLVNPPTELLATYNQKQQRQAELENSGHDDADIEYLQQEYDQLLLDIAALEAQLEPYLTYTAEQHTSAGCIVYLDHDGTIGIQEGLVERVHASDTANSKTETAAVNTVSDPGHGYSQSLQQDLSTYRTQILQSAITTDFAASFDLMVFTLCTKIFDSSRHYPIDTTLHRFQPRTALDDTDQTTCCTGAILQREKLSLDWLQHTDNTFAAFCALTIQEKQDLFSYCTSELITTGLSDAMHPALLETACKLNVDVRSSWCPTDATVFNRLKKAQLLNLVEELLGDAWRQRLADYKKSALASWLNRLFSGDAAVVAGIDANALQRVQQWLPEGMRFMDDDPHHDESELELTSPVEQDNVHILSDTDVALPNWMTEAASLAS